MFTHPHCHQVSPPDLPYSSTARAEPGAPMKMGQVERTMRHGVKPMAMSTTNSKPSATLAETQSRLASNGSEARNAPNRRYTGLIEARNRERLAGLASSTRSFTWLTGTSVVSTASWGDARRAAMVAATSSPRPCGLRVGTSSTTRAPNAVTSSRSWVTTTMLTPSERKSWISRTICIQVRLSCPKVGSSNSSTFGAEASAEATVSLRFSPPDNVYGLTCAYWSRWNLLSRSMPRARACSSAIPVRSGPSMTSSSTLEQANWCSGFWNT